MPVHNAASYLSASVSSVLDQTYHDFEFVILDDASTDGSLEILHGWAQRDARIRVIESRIPLGLAESANRVVREARAPVCARMDADDVSLPDRLRSQWTVLEANPEVCVVGTLWQGIDATGRVVRPRDRWRLFHLLALAPFPHGSIMFRRDAFRDVGGYRRECEVWEDLDLFFRMLERGRILVLPDVLYHHRFHLASTTWARSREQLAHALDTMYRCATDRRTRGGPTASRKASRGAIPAHLEVSPAALYYLGALRLWAGHSPAILGLLRFVRFRWPTAALMKALVFGVWGALSPRSLRLFLSGAIWSRDWIACRVVRDGVPVEWTGR